MGADADREMVGMLAEKDCWEMGRVAGGGMVESEIKKINQSRANQSLEIKKYRVRKCQGGGGLTKLNFGVTEDGRKRDREGEEDRW